MNSFSYNGEQFKVRPIEPDEAWKIAWPRNEGDWVVLHDANMYSRDQTETWLKNMPASSKRLVIHTHKDAPPPSSTGIWVWEPEVVGVIRIDQIDQTNRSCFVGMDINKHFRGKGLSRPAYEWLFWYLFENLNMNALYLEVLETNKLAIKVYEKVGFKYAGRWPQRVFREGVYIDALLFSLLRGDYNASKALSDKSV